MKAIFVKPLPTLPHVESLNKEFNETFSIGTVFEVISIQDDVMFEFGLKVPDAFAKDYGEFGCFPLFKEELETSFKVLK